jgi:hypothetical protein
LERRSWAAAAASIEQKVEPMNSRSRWRGWLIVGEDDRLHRQQRSFAREVREHRLTDLALQLS